MNECESPWITKDLHTLEENLNARHLHKPLLHCRWTKGYSFNQLTGRQTSEPWTPKGEKNIQMPWRFNTIQMSSWISSWIFYAMRAAVEWKFWNFQQHQINSNSRKGGPNCMWYVGQFCHDPLQAQRNISLVWSSGLIKTQLTSEDLAGHRCG